MTHTLYGRNMKKEIEVWLCCSMQQLILSEDNYQKRNYLYRLYRLYVLIFYDLHKKVEMIFFAFKWILIFLLLIKISLAPSNSTTAIFGNKNNFVSFIYYFPLAWKRHSCFSLLFNMHPLNEEKTFYYK